MITLGIAATVIFTACLDHPTIHPTLAAQAPASGAVAQAGAVSEQAGSAANVTRCEPAPHAATRSRNAASDASSEKN